MNMPTFFGSGLRQEAQFPDRPILDVIDLYNTKVLFDTVQYVMDGSRALVEFVDHNRHVARLSGIETLAVELGSIVDSRRLDGVHDALEEGILKERPVQLTADGLGYLRRAERLLSEATREIASFSGLRSGFPIGRPASLGQTLGPSAAPPGQSHDLLILGIAAIIGVAVVAIVLSSR